jgi:spermidine synthase
MKNAALPVLTLAFFLSGAAALTYEILWQRQMFLVFGASAPATTAILTAIFLGIAFGSRFAVPVLRRIRDPRKLYLVLELTMAGWGLLVPSVLAWADHVYVALARSFGEAHPFVAGTRFVLAVISVLPATLAMGATIPVMIRCISSVSSSGVAWAYGINILGSVLGCLLTGFVWIAWLGVHQTRLVAVALNLASAGLAATLLGTQTESAETDPSETEEAAALPLSGKRGLVGMYFSAGLVALGMEIVWLRFLGIINTNSTITFTLTLAIFLFGMGLGSLIVYPLLKRVCSARAIFSLANGAIAAGALLTFNMVYRAASINQDRINRLSRLGELQLHDVYLTEALVIAGLMFVPTLFMGMVYPAVCDCFEGTRRERDRWVGRIYFWGTLGSVVGILLVASVVIPWLGLHATLAALIGLSILICLLSIPQDWHSSLKLAALAGCVGLGSGALSLSIDPRPVLRETRAEKRGGVWKEVSLEEPPRELSDIVRVKSGTTATVYVKKNIHNEDHLVYVDDQLVASTNLEAKVDALMLAHLPLLLHPAPGHALTVGFGTGGTSFAMTRHGVETYCVEIEAEVPRSAYLMPDQNFNVLERPNFTLILNDARDHLHAGTRRYDVISTDVTNLQYKQNANLYTVEYFRLLREKLTPRGIACAWIPMAAIDTRELRILMRGFQEVFPHATLWYMNHTHTNFGILIGTPEPLTIDYRRLAAGFSNADVAENLKLVGMTEPLQLVHCLHLDEEGYREFCGDVPLHTDDQPILEFSSPMSFYRYEETFRDNLDATLRLRPREFRRFVSHAPEELGPQFEQHGVASRQFCLVVLRMYRSVLARQRNDHAALLHELKEAISAAETGMAAWPDDRVREEFYINFFSESQQWLQRHP